jgi:hypothetical protein
MRRGPRPIIGFRRRLLGLIEERFAGRYTALAMRARIPVSTMEHYIHLAKRLPGGENLLRLAEALDVSVEYLMAGEHAVRPADGLAHPGPIVTPRGTALASTHFAIPLFWCACPDTCPLAATVPPVAAARSKVVLETDLLPRHGDRRLIAVQVTASLPSSEWPDGSRLVVDWDARERRSAATMLSRADDRCRLGHFVRTGGRLFLADRVGGAPQLITEPYTIGGTVIGAVAAL